MKQILSLWSWKRDIVEGKRDLAGKEVLSFSKTEQQSEDSSRFPFQSNLSFTWSSSFTFKGYDLGRDLLTGNATISNGTKSEGGFEYMTTSTQQSLLSGIDTSQINHGVSRSGPSFDWPLYGRELNGSTPLALSLPLDTLRSQSMETSTFSQSGSQNKEPSEVDLHLTPPLPALVVQVQLALCPFLRVLQSFWPDWLVSLFSDAPISRCLELKLFI